MSVAVSSSYSGATGRRLHALSQLFNLKYGVNVLNITATPAVRAEVQRCK